MNSGLVDSLKNADYTKDDEIVDVKQGYEAVQHPKHYNSHPSGIECIDIVQHHNFNIGSAIKYLWRQGLKPNEEDVQDLKKAIKYIEFEIKRIGKK